MPLATLSPALSPAESLYQGILYSFTLALPQHLLIAAKSWSVSSADGMFLHKALMCGIVL